MAIEIDPFTAVRGVPIEQYRAGMGEYLGASAADAWANSSINQLVRLGQVSAAEMAAERTGQTLLTADEANEQGRTLGLRFDQPISRGAYDIIAGEKQRQIAAEGVFQRARLEQGYGTLKWALAGGTEFLTQLADPINIVASFIPVVGEARYAMMAARIGAPAAMVARGAIEGAVGQAMLEPIAALERRQMGEEYGLLDTVLDLAQGAGFGVALHGVHYGAGAGFRFLRDRYILSEPRRPSLREPPAAAGEPVSPEAGPRPEELAVEERATPPPRQPVAEQMERLHPVTLQTALRTGIAELADDKRVDVEPVLHSDPAWPEIETDIKAMQAHLELQRQAIAATAPVPWTVPAEHVPQATDLAVARRLARGWTAETPLERPLSLADWVRKMGGLQEGTPEADNLRVLAGLEKGDNKGLIVAKEKGGRDVEHLAQAAHEEGYPVPRTEIGSGVDVAGFVEALAADHNQSRRMMPDDSYTADWEAQQRFFEEVNHSLQDLGLEPRGMDPRRLAYIMSQDPDHGRLLSLLDRIANLNDRSSLELVDRLDRERVEAERRILDESGAHEEDMAADHREFPPATLQDVEAFYELERTATREDSGGRQPLEGGAAGGGPLEDREAQIVGPGRGAAAAEAPGLRPEARRAEGAAAARERTAADLTAFAERQQHQDLHADFEELARRDERLAQEHATVDRELQEAMEKYGDRLTDEDRQTMANIERFGEEATRATDALASCKFGGG